jgi:hypothetical protein
MEASFKPRYSALVIPRPFEILKEKPEAAGANVFSVQSRPFGNVSVMAR